MIDRSKQFRFYLLLLFVAVIPLFSLGLANHGVWTADEPRVAEIGREMALTNNLAVPSLDQKPFLEEPPFYYAAIAAVFDISGGPSDKTVRIPSAVFALGGVLALFILGNLLFGPRIGFISAFILATCGEYFRVAHWVVVDSALACFIILALTFFVTAYLSEGRGRRFLFYGLCYVSCTLAFYAKGFIGIAIPALAVLSFVVLDRNIKEILRMHLWFGIAVFLVMTLPWFLALWRQGGVEYLKIFLVHNHLERFAGGSTGHSQPFYYYLTQFPGGFLPWSLLLIPVFYWSFRKQGHLEGREKKGVLFAMCWFVSGFIFLSAASTKRVLYLMPIFAPIALLTASYIQASLKRTDFKGFEKFFLLLFGLVIVAIGFAVTPLSFYASRKYGFGLPMKEVSWIVCLSLVSLVLSLTAISKYKVDMGRFWTFSGASIFSLLLLGLIAVVPLLDRYKTFVPFCDAIKAAAPAATTIYAYQPDETLRGAVPFYTGHFLKEIETSSALDDALEKRGAFIVVIRDKGGQLERELLSTGKLSVLAKYGMDPSRTLVVFGNTRVSR
jgi:4-amino-4-deoxy-L-arabinose transferase-like glycosyltransferase